MTPMTSPDTFPRAAAAPAAAQPPSAAVRFGRELGYLVSSLPIGVVSFTVGFLGLAAGVATAIVYLGVPILVGTLLAARGLARGERRRVESVTGRPLPPHVYRERGDRSVKGLIAALAEPQSWRDLAHAIVSFPLRIVNFCLTVTWVVGGLGMLLYVTWSWALPEDEETGLLDLTYDISSESANIAFTTGLGLVALLTAPLVTRGLFLVNAAMARGLLTNPYAASRLAVEG
ncbi:sensor domain-containing protein [Streptomyces sp. PT12]|uniref:sensor domain-containing protein n=1 Tax=Streptomyces sp. PT12 TaxID=1510197 RepID=UPI000DE21FB4|nr:sensor domain-containing protein [Streptomyces sp. PT12]RBM07315.1 hypothetical protein DEH69_25035 [Streptomyces sp. PT12]